MPASAEGAWAPGPKRPRLTDGAVHVWRVDLSTVSGDELGKLLCHEERTRAARLVNARKGELWRRSRGLLRALLGRYLQRDPSSLRLAVGEHGKPGLAMNDNQPRLGPEPQVSASRLSFNLSHSGELALYAFSDAGEVGVDVEVPRRSFDDLGVARRVFGADEARRLDALEPELRRLEFLRAWTRHEAELKCLGVGIGRDQADVRAHRLWVLDLDLECDAAGAVACERVPRELRRWRWPS
jgi:4'-phosphopantetheinyl transferase